MADYLKNIPFNSKNENSSTAALYKARQFYKNSSIAYITSSYIDELNLYGSKIEKNVSFLDLYNQDVFYGYLDDDLDVIAPIENRNNFKYLNGTTFYLQNFAADAFNDMMDHLDLQKYKCYDGDVSVTEGYASNDTLCNSIYTIIGEKFRSLSFSNLNIKNIKTHVDFNREFINFLKIHLNICPVTKSRLTLFFNLKNYCNSLTLRITNIDTTNDEDKYIYYYLERNFFIFSEACRRFGFKQDKNIPFLLTVDLASDALKKYLKNYDLKDYKDVFKKRFKKVYLEDLNSLKMFFYNSYKIFLRENEYSIKELDTLCSGQLYDNLDVLRDNVNENVYFSTFTNYYWIRLYIYFKNLEHNSNFTQDQFENLVREANNYIVNGKEELCLQYINKKFNDLKGTLYYDTLQVQQDMIENRNASAGRLPQNEIIF